MADEHRNQGNRNRGRHHHRHRSGGSGRGGGGRGQRPLLTSAINAAGLSLVGLIVMSTLSVEFGELSLWLGTATILYCLSAIVSYVAQRVSARIVEKICDVFFLAGTVILIAVAWQLSGFMP